MFAGPFVARIPESRHIQACRSFTRPKEVDPSNATKFVSADGRRRK